MNFTYITRYTIIRHIVHSVCIQFTHNIKCNLYELFIFTIQIPMISAASAFLLYRYIQWSQRIPSSSQSSPLKPDPPNPPQTLKDIKIPIIRPITQDVEKEWSQMALSDYLRSWGHSLIRLRNQIINKTEEGINNSQFISNARTKYQKFGIQYGNPFLKHYQQIPQQITKIKYKFISEKSIYERLLVVSFMTCLVSLASLNRYRHQLVLTRLLWTFRNATFTYFSTAIMITPQVFYPLMAQK